MTRSEIEKHLYQVIFYTFDNDLRLEKITTSILRQENKLKADRKN